MRKTEGNRKNEVIDALPKQRALRRRPAKSVWSGVTLAADAIFVKSKSPTIDFKQLFLRRPVLPLAAHALAKDAGVQLAAARVANAIQDPVGFGRKSFAQASLEIGSDAAGQTQHVDESPGRATIFRAL